MRYFDAGTAAGGMGTTRPRMPLPAPININPMPLQPVLPTFDQQATQSSPDNDFEDQAGLSVQTLFRQTGLGIKIRFLLALTLIAVFPAIILVSLLGDPFGQEQQATLSQALILQARAQGNAVDTAIASRQKAMSILAHYTPDSTQLQIEQQSDLTSLAWLVVQSDGTITAAGAEHMVGTNLFKTKLVAHPAQLTSLVQSPSTKGTTAINADGWMAIAYPQASSAGVVLSLFSWQKLTQDVVTVKDIDGLTAVLLDQQGRLVAEAGVLADGQKLFATAPQSLTTFALGNASPTIVANNLLTGRSDVVVGVAVAAIGGRYLLMAPQDTAIISSTRSLFDRRNTPLLLLATLVAVVLVSTWVALPIIRPIRRATREIGYTTEEVRRLAISARQIAKDHHTGTILLSGASKRLGGRRQSIIRDGTAITQICTSLWPRAQWLQQVARGSSNKQLLETLQIIQQGIYQINGLGSSIANGLEKDTMLSQLDGAMESAREISMQFEAAGVQLERDAEQLEAAAQTLM